MNNSTNQTPLFVLSGPASDNGTQHIDVVASDSSHKFYFYDDSSATEISELSVDKWVSTCVCVNGVGVAAISHTLNRVGHTFGYSSSGDAPQAYGTLQNNGNININL